VNKFLERNALRWNILNTEWMHINSNYDYLYHTLGSICQRLVIQYATAKSTKASKHCWNCIARTTTLTPGFTNSENIKIFLDIVRIFDIPGPRTEACLQRFAKLLSKNGYSENSNVDKTQKPIRNSNSEICSEIIHQTLEITIDWFVTRVTIVQHCKFPDISLTFCGTLTMLQSPIMHRVS